MTDSNELIKLLNNLIETCKDGQKGFREAAEAIEDDSLKKSFMDYSAQRARFAEELQTEVEMLGGEPEKGGSASGSVHRGWINLRSVISGHKPEAIVSECERGEDVAVKEYQQALSKPLTPALKAVLQRQFEQVERVHDHMRSLELAVRH